MSIDTTAIQQFLESVKRATQTRSRDVRLAVADATVLSAEIAMIMSRLVTLENKLTGVQATSIGMDGGSLG